jgi:hypothetical protein
MVFTKLAYVPAILLLIFADGCPPGSQSRADGAGQGFQSAKLPESGSRLGQRKAERRKGYTSF